MADSQQAQVQLTPAQQAALDRIEFELTRVPWASLVSFAGMGKSMIVRVLAARHGAKVLGLNDYMRQATLLPYDKWQDRIGRLLRDELGRTDMLILDDCGYLSIHETRLICDLRSICDEAARLGKKVVLVGRNTRAEYEPDNPIFVDTLYDVARIPLVMLSEQLTADDIRSLIVVTAGARAAAAIDVDVVQLQAASLAPREVILVCHALLHEQRDFSTENFLEATGRFVLRESIVLRDVETLSFDTLPGTEAIARALEDHVVMPFENPEVALEMGVKARRGVMLFGPPGTGKTSIGRALAHRMKGKFFLIDGSIATEPPHIFLSRVNAIIDRAIATAPSVLFIDDADNLFSIPYVAGVVRRLLSLLDGLETQKASRVCVMMTVMDPVHIPDALLRSGRVEMWLETQPPEQADRSRMFARWSAGTTQGPGEIDFDLLAERSEGFTPADIRRVMGDARLLFAQDRKGGRQARTATDYARQAIDDLVTMRGSMKSVLAGQDIASAQDAQEMMA